MALLVPGLIIGFAAVLFYLFITNPPEDLVATLAIGLPVFLSALGITVFYRGRCRRNRKKPNRDILTILFLTMAVSLACAGFSAFIYAV